MMYATRSALGESLLLSLVLHAALIAAGSRLAATAPRIARPALAPMAVALRDPPREIEQPVAVAPRLPLPQSPPRNPSAARPFSAASLSGAAQRSALEQISRELLYPPEAIERGLQGEALVLLFLDASGNAIAARLEASSGHELLDDAAVRAARTLRSLPDSAPREALLPVRFRLR